MNFNLSPYDLDIMARTIAGEAGGEGPLGMQAVGEVILNRLGTGGFGGTAADVALAPNQFSAWNQGEGGNSIPRATGPGQGGYERAMAAALAALGGDDPTMGATHYYAPQGMPGGREPDWWGEVASMGSTSIGNHRFAGGSQARGILAQALSGKGAPEGPPTEAGADTYTRAGNQAALEAQAPVGHWTQGLANALNMGYSGYMDRLALEQGAGAETAANDAAAQQQAEAARIAAEQEAYNRGQDERANVRADAGLALDQDAAAREQADAAKAAEDAAFAAANPEYDFAAEEGLRKEYQLLPTVKNFAEQSAALGRIEEAAAEQSGAGDIALVFSYMKVLDPTSTVRESEFAQAVQSGGVPGVIGGLYNKIIGDGQLTPEIRAELLKTSHELYSAAKSGYEKTYSQYADIAKARGLDIGRALPQYGYDKVTAGGLEAAFGAAPAITAQPLPVAPPQVPSALERWFGP